MLLIPNYTFAFVAVSGRTRALQDGRGRGGQPHGAAGAAGGWTQVRVLVLGCRGWYSNVALVAAFSNQETVQMGVRIEQRSAGNR